MSDPDTPQRPASALLFEELRREQRAFRGVMTAMAAVLLLAAVIATGGAVFSYLQLQTLRAEYTDQLSRSEANLKVLAGEAARQRETFNTRFQELQLAQNSANRALDDRLAAERADDLAPFRETAIERAQSHVVEDPLLNASTAVILTQVVSAADAGEAPLSDAERLLLGAVSSDWAGNPNQSREQFQELYDGEHPDTWRAYGAAGLASFHYREADEGDLLWEEGCGAAVGYADEAIALGLDAPSLRILQGQCLRKNGDTLSAYDAFRTARLALGETASAVRDDGSAPRDDDRWWEQIDLRRPAVHGEGTTLVALVAGGQPPEALADPLDEAHRWLKRAARLRGLRNATETGLAYTNENIGFIYVIDRDWDAALTHTAEIDRVLPMAWNLTIRHIAAVEKAKALAAADAPSAEVAAMYAIADEAERVLSMMRYGQFDEAELLRMLSERYADTVARLAKPAKGRAGMIRGGAEVAQAG